MTVVFYRFSKRANSTKVASNADGTSLTCVLKDVTDMSSPTLVIKNVPVGWMPIWNYCFISEFRRFYFINNWEWNNGVWSCSTSCDVLASYKDEIGAMSEYILRSSHSSNGQIVDLAYPTTAETRVDARRILTYPFQSVLAGGYYIVGIISNDSNAAQGAVTYYQMTPAELSALRSYMMSDTFITQQSLDIPTVTSVIPTELLKTLYDPFEYIASCIWIPLPASTIPNELKTTEQNIKFGWWTPQTAITGKRINANGYVATLSERISISGHPQRAARGVFLDHAPFVDRMLYYPPYGSIPINDDSIIGGDFIRVELTVDTVFGNSVLSVYHDRPLGGGNYTDMGVVGRASAQLAVPIQLAQAAVDLNSLTDTGIAVGIGAASSLVGSLASSAKSGKSFLGALADAAGALPEIAVSAIGDVLAAPISQLSTTGSNGSLAQYSVWPYFVEKYRIVADDDNSKKGRPLCETRTIRTIPGFIMVDSPDVSIDCLAPERDKIVAYMQSGFFWE